MDRLHRTGQQSVEWKDMNLGEGIAEQAYAEGRAEGRAEGKEQVATLFRKLIADKSTSELLEITTRMAEDEEYCKKMFAEYGIE